jgi:hypothetical protein
MYIKDRKGNSVKLIPARYKEIPDVDCYIEDFEHKRLSEEERELLDRILLGIRLEKFTKQKKENYIYRDQIGDAYPEKAIKVIKRTGEHYYVIRYSNKKEFRCEADILSNLPVETENRLY